MTKPKLHVVESQSQSEYETLWREFPQLKNSALVYRVAMANADGKDCVAYGFRLLDGSYVTVRCTASRNVLEGMPAQEIEILEPAWQELGNRALEGTSADTPHGIMDTSDEFVELAESDLFDLWEDAMGAGHRH